MVLAYLNNIESFLSEFPIAMQFILIRIDEDIVLKIDDGLSEFVREDEVDNFHGYFYIFWLF